MKRSLLASMAMPLLAAAISATALPAVADDGTWYIGGSIGDSRVKINDNEINNALVAAGATTSSTNRKDESDTGYKLFFGYRVNANVAIEAGYFDLGKVSLENAVTVGAFGANINSEAKNKGGFNIDVVISAPITDAFSVFGRLGVQRSKTDFTASAVVGATPITVSQSDSITGAKFGLGVQYDFTKQFGLRGEWERYRVSDGANGKADSDLYSLGVVVRF